MCTGVSEEPTLPHHHGLTLILNVGTNVPEHKAPVIFRLTVVRTIRLRVLWEFTHPINIYVNVLQRETMVATLIISINVRHWVMFLLVIFTVEVPVFLPTIPQYVNNKCNTSQQ